MLGLGGLTYLPMQQVFPNGAELISRQVAKLEKAYSEGKISSSLWEQYKIQLRHLQSATSPDVETLTMPMVSAQYYGLRLMALLTISSSTLHSSRLPKPERPT
jgi:hypothetical protein